MHPGALPRKGRCATMQGARRLRTPRPAFILMTTKLDRVLKRELAINGEPYTLTISDEGFTLTLKGRRKGLDIRWADLVRGDAALATALNASLTANIAPRSKPPEKDNKETKSASRSKTDRIAEERPAARPRNEPTAKPRKPQTAPPKTKTGRAAPPRASSPRSR